MIPVNCNCFTSKKMYSEKKKIIYQRLDEIAGIEFDNFLED
jgi:hypothetical protein